MRRTASKDASRVRTEQEALYYSAGIPSRAWKKAEHKIEFQPIMGDEGDTEIKVGAALQEQWYKSLMEGELFKDPYLIYLSSSNADGLSDRIGYEIMKVALANNQRVQITNAGGIDYEESDDESVFMLHNVFADANKYRLQLIRDWITSHEDVFRLVVISGPCPYEFSKLIYLRPDAMFKVDKAVTKVRTSRA